MTIGLALLLAAGPRQHLGPPAPAEVRRVVTLAPSLSEIVLALGARDRLVGVTRFDDDLRTEKLPRIGGYNEPGDTQDRKSTRLNSSHVEISYAVFCLK